MKFQVSVYLVFYSFFSGTLHVWMTEAQSQADPDPPITAVINFIKSDHSFLSNGKYYVRSDENLVMNCSSDANPVVHECEWRFYEGNTHRLDIVTVGDTNGHCLFNQRVDVKFTSVRCITTNILGPMWSSKAAFTVVPTTRSVIIHPANLHNNLLTIRRGENLELSCSVDYGIDLDATYQWEGPYGFSSATSKLSLTQFRSSDTGDYTCTTTDPFGSFKRRIYIDVVYRPVSAVINFIKSDHSFLSNGKYYV